MIHIRADVQHRPLVYHFHLVEEVTTFSSSCSCAGRDVVFHCATASPSASNASNEELMYAVNVRGTEHVVAACKVRRHPAAQHVLREVFVSP